MYVYRPTPRIMTCQRNDAIYNRTSAVVEWTLSRISTDPRQRQRRVAASILTREVPTSGTDTEHFIMHRALGRRARRRRGLHCHTLLNGLFEK